MSFEFLTSPRFWLLFAASLTYAAENGFSAEAIVHAIYLLVAGFIGIRTVDRFGEKIGR